MADSDAEKMDPWRNERRSEVARSLQAGGV